MKKYLLLLVAQVVLSVQLACAEAPANVGAVDMGLSVKWASMNVGATAPEGFGDFFAWGETRTKYDSPFGPTYTWHGYKWHNQQHKGDLRCEVYINKYNPRTISNNPNQKGATDNRTQLEPNDDAAHVNWGGAWRMPTEAEWRELMQQCTWTWTTLNEVAGFKVTARNGNSIFLPAAGTYDSFRRDHQNCLGHYWSSSLTDNSPEAWSLEMVKLTDECGDVNLQMADRYYGRSVRAVCP